MRVIKDTHTKRSKGIAYVEFDSQVKVNCFVEVNCFDPPPSTALIADCPPCLHHDGNWVDRVCFLLPGLSVLAFVAGPPFPPLAQRRVSQSSTSAGRCQVWFDP